MSPTCTCGTPQALCRDWSCERCGRDTTLWESPLCPNCEAQIVAEAFDFQIETTPAIKVSCLAEWEHNCRGPVEIRWVTDDVLLPVCPGAAYDQPSLYRDELQEARELAAEQRDYWEAVS